MEDIQKSKLKEVAQVFFRMGIYAFGGPAAHIAMMEEEIVKKRKWMNRQHFLDLVGATNLIPGPNSTEMTMHCGHERAGVAGLFVAGITFIFPAVLITAVMAWLYVTYGELPAIAPFFIGIKPAVIALIVSSVYTLGKKALKGWELGAIGAIALIASLTGINEIFALLGAGLIGAFYFLIKNKQSITPVIAFPFFVLPTISGTVAISTTKIFWTFLKVGSVLYGSGMVLFAYLDAELVSKGYLLQQQLIDAIAVGQFTPGPVLSTATFVGYQLGGFAGAIAATIGIFLPSFLLVWLLNPLVPKMRKSKLIGYFLDSVNIASVAVIAAIAIKMGMEVIVNWQAIVVLGLGLFFTFGPKKLNAMWLVLGGSVVGYLLDLI
jgi:chromate transporter